MADDDATSDAELLAELRARDARIEQLRLERDAFAKNFELLKEADVELKHELDGTRRQVHLLSHRRPLSRRPSR